MALQVAVVAAWIAIADGLVNLVNKLKGKKVEPSDTSATIAAGAKAQEKATTQPAGKPPASVAPEAQG